MVEGARLESELPVKSRYEGSNPSRSVVLCRTRSRPRLGSGCPDRFRGRRFELRHPWPRTSFPPRCPPGPPFSTSARSAGPWSRMATEIVERGRRHRRASCSSASSAAASSWPTACKRLIDQSEGSSRPVRQARHHPLSRRSPDRRPRPGGRRDPAARPRRADRRHRGRRALHRPHRARGARRVRRLRPAAPDPALRADRPRRAASCRSRPTSSAPRSSTGPGDRVDVLVVRARRPRRGRAGAGG